MAPQLTRTEYLRALARPKRRFQTVVLEGSRLTLHDPVSGPSYWFERNDIGQEHPSGRYLQMPSLGTISLIVDGQTVAFFYLSGRELDTCTFAYDLTPAQLSKAALVMKRARLQRLIRPAAEWAIQKMPDQRRPVLEKALRTLLRSHRVPARCGKARRRTRG
jgi:hypothetical protein